MSGGLTPATVVRRLPVVDELDRDGQRLVLRSGRAVLVHGLGPSILDLTAEPVTLTALSERLVALHGSPPGLDPVSLVVEATQALLEEGLVEQVSPTPRPRAGRDPRGDAGRR